MGYDRRTTEIHAAIAQLTALTGHEPRITDDGGTVRIEADLTTALVPRWLHLLAVLDLGAAYGLRSSEDRQTAWLRFDLPEGPP
ncbi:hypothetical protein [Streptomyces clavuligerus]|uniref:hypothetical protein n=1 Tax=Streptomyces clavuligerus TaxID=1901 RepID=UPI00020D9140|nr:hypothetical protein [Streptomyces clavuligerus]ANW22635.1 hypothetical protein BB341_30490 [Streptomyces clavuligerus]AXU16897.1 hypothetical protein D1794_29495 [Streptomyces clavuligerus]AXU17494.1 hypothetical protein D1794_33660 [Streptomyces clavuligerus]MBY6301026.1 hypothetical protein [Streptomyces clavuligerus]QPJ96971.1 hypothetical protein GE265_28020 [Streptomyces clavuligerus]